MIVTLGTVHPDSQERLAYLGHHSFRALPQTFVKINRGIIHEGACSQEELPDHSIVRFVFNQRLTDPTVELPSSLYVSSTGLKEIGKLQRPKVYEFPAR